MGLSWHNEDYAQMVLEMEDYLIETHGHIFDVGDVHSIVGHMITIMIDHGAVDPT